MKPKNISVDQIIDMLKESFSLVKLYKIFIVFGILFALFGGMMMRVSVNFSSGTQVNYTNNYNNRSSGDKDYEIFKNSKLNEGVDKLREIEIGTILLVAGVICCLGIVSGVVRLYVRNVSNNVLIGAVDLVDKKSDLKFKSLWNYGHAVVLKTIALDIMFGVAGVVLAIVSFFLIFCCGLGLVTLFVGGIALSVLLDMAKRFLVLKNRSIMDSITDAWELMRNNLVNFIVYAVALFVFSIMYAIVSLIIAIPIAIVWVIVFMILGLPIFLISFIAMPLGLLVFNPFMIIMILLLIVIGAMMYGPVLAVVEIWKTKYWKLVTSKR